MAHQCTNKTTTLPASTTLKPTTFNKTALPTSISTKPSTSEISSFASPTPTTANSTPTIPTTSTSITTGTTLQPGCEFNIVVTNNTADVEIINGNTSVTYTVTLKETSNGNEIIHTVEKQSSRTQFLIKPCTKYTVEVNACKAPQNKSFRTQNDTENITVSTVNDWNDKHVCFKVEKWNFTKCVDINDTAGCSVVPIVENLDTCDYTIKVHMPPGKPEIDFTEKIPTQFDWSNKPTNCSGAFQIHCTRGELHDCVIEQIKVIHVFCPLLIEPIFTSKKIEVTHPSHNSIEITCKDIPKNHWNGGKVKYKAELEYEGYPNTPTNKKPEEKETCQFSFSDLSYLTEYRIKITATNEEKKKSKITRTTTTKYNDKAVIGFLAFLIIVTSVALLFVLFKIFLLKRKRTPEEIPLTSHSLQNIDPILAENLIEVYKRKIADEGRLFMDEFQSIPRIFSNYTIKEAKKQENQSKNRYVDILPYDYNRVVLTEGSNDYINASFIEGFKEPKKYIAAQGPKDETIEDFWRMIWEQKSSIIVMVTRCEEGNKTKCAQYWPYLERETEIYEDFVVKIKSEEHCPDYIIRHLLVTNKREKAAEREVTHIQFTSWPDHGVPGDPSLLLKLRRRVNSFKNFFSGPIVIHCSAGVGRTGTYIGIDAMIESLESEGRMDIYGYVAKLRRQRCLMVQVESQYILIHTALIEHNQFGETEVLLSDFHSELNTLRHKDGNDTSLLEMEFQKLPKFKNWRTFNTATNEDNKKKNRYSTVVPYDYNRVLFRLELDSNQTSDPEDEDESSSDEEEESNEYINASFIDGYWCGKSLIAAQGPLANTAAEFLLMLYQQQTKTIVMLTDCKEDDKDYCFQYWGDEKKTFGDIEIEVKKTESFTTYVRRRLAIQSTKKKDVLEMDQYQFLKWKSRELPENAQDLIEMMRSIRESGGYDNSRKNRSIPIVVHCNNGSSRTGIFCALWNLLDCALTEKLVDVFQAVKNVRKERQGMIETFEQYQFLYTALEGAFPVQNGGIKSQASDSIQIINETTALLSEQASSTNTDQKEEEEKKEETSKPKESEEQKDTDAPAPPADAPAADATATATAESSTSPSPPEGDNEKPSTEGTTNGPTVTVDV
nr:receptor-type tyrosine-protein phosphatase C [Misgurnus anguillicaudatus]